MKRLLKSGSFWFGVLAVLFLIAGVVASRLLWGWLHPEKPTTVSNSETLRNVGLLIGGGLAFVFAGWRAWVAERQANATQHQAETAQRQAEIVQAQVETSQDQIEIAQRQAETAQLSLLNERYQRGAEMLGSEVLAVRLGGIYALRRLAVEHPEQYHLQIMELFCAYVRNPTGELEGRNLPNDAGKPFRELRDDVQAVVWAIGNRSETDIALEQKGDPYFRLYLPGVNIESGQLSGLNLTGAFLNKSNLSGACLIGANFSNTSLEGADFSGAHLFRANFSGARLNGANFSDAILESSNLSDADLIGANLSNANLGSANLSDARLHDANLSDADLREANLHGTGLIGTCLSGARLRGAYLFNASLWTADLSRASLVGANLAGADLLDANLENANLTNAFFNKHWLSDDSWSPAKGLMQEQLDVARSDSDNLPRLAGVLDAANDEQLVWQGRPLGDEGEES